MNTINDIQLYKNFLTGFNSTNKNKKCGHPINGIIKIVLDVDQDEKQVPLKFMLTDTNNLNFKTINEYKNSIENKPNFPLICDL